MLCYLYTIGAPLCMCIYMMLWNDILFYPYEYKNDDLYYHYYAVTTIFHIVSVLPNTN